VPHAQEECRYRRADDDARQAEAREAAERGEQNQIVRQARVAADEHGPQEVIDETNDEHADEDQRNAAENLAAHDQVDRRR
jgi:hypothetical protein